MIKLARRWSELVQCELVGFVLLVQHQRTYASQLMSDSHEPDVVLCAEVRIDRLQRFNDFNHLEIDPESNRWLALSSDGDTSFSSALSASGRSSND